MNKKQSSKYMAILLGAVLLIGLAVFLFSGRDSVFEQSDSAQTDTEEPAETSDEEDSETLEDDDVPEDLDDEEDSAESDDSSVLEEQPVMFEESAFELPVVGAGGYTSVETGLHGSPTKDVPEKDVLDAGTPFMVREEQGDWWHIQTENQQGWINNRLALINLPDVVPSIIYDNPNNYASIFRSSFMDIPGITGEKLYEGFGYNERLGRDEFIMPIIYSTAMKIAQAQQAAMENDETLVVMETFRPFSAQVLVNEKLTALAEENDEVREGLTEEPWSMNWFINTGVSNHQRGLAVDLTLARVNERDEKVIDQYIVPHIIDYTVYEMYSPIFELSTASAMLIRPIAARNRTGWQDIPYHDYVNEEAIRLESYMFEADMIPIPSEWWHFNDIDVLEAYEGELGSGGFQLENLLNAVPSQLEQDNDNQVD
ncbi:hypothetical protein ADIAL_1120 [Alkalibacterium sp. AK22]|uniref:D-alanyl-D-alanine carboxypeptidase family protein n=1 Tax=Alkalibacterium sp. AK22 TaxID=1229520 RepID=UPI000446993E|nr:D-alanyl-D-alanine carboxypeptidase family protein [Alkalibacterium sp. AK22]EXJ23416.1 hypothetical protein ADIAL_1120 [Alkalibacterium sp. AK22]